jgi:hypothetical protein
MKMLLAGAVLSGALPAFSVACHAAPAPWAHPTPAAWTELRQALDHQRQARPREPWAAGLRVTLREPRTGRVVDGRGAIAVSPGRAVRMILVGGAGATVLDAWVTPQRWRVAVPPLDLVRRGGSDEPRDMPVGFLRWWLLTPLEGTLFAAAFTEGDPRWLLRDDGAVVELRQGVCPGGGALHATRRAAGHAETVDECRQDGAPRAGDSAGYVDEGSGLRVDLQFESVASQPPSGEAFDDPDQAGSGT